MTWIRVHPSNKSRMTFKRERVICQSSSSIVVDFTTPFSQVPFVSSIRFILSQGPENNSDGYEGLGVHPPSREQGTAVNEPGRQRLLASPPLLDPDIG